MKFLYPEKAGSIKKNTKFHPDSFKGIKPHHVLEFLHVLAYGKRRVNYEVDKPTKARSSTVEFYKKAISYYMMPAGKMQWNGKEGNPTQHASIAKLLRAMKRAEVRKQGKPSQATRPLNLVEWRFLLKSTREAMTFLYSQVYVAYVVYCRSTLLPGAQMLLTCRSRT